MKTTRLRRLLPAVLCGLLAAFPGPRASAVFLFTVAQEGDDVVVTGSGTLNTSALSFLGPDNFSPGTLPALSLLYSGPLSSEIDAYNGITTAPDNFGGGNGVDAMSGTGNFVGVLGFGFPSLYVPTGYISGTPLSNTSTYVDTTVGDLGFVAGNYTFAWGSGASADSLIINVPDFSSSVPEPSTWALLSLGAGGLSLAWRRRTRRPA